MKKATSNTITVILGVLIIILTSTLIPIGLEGQPDQFYAPYEPYNETEPNEESDTSIPFKGGGGAANVIPKDGGVLEQQPTDNSTIPNKRLGTLEQSQSPIPNPKEGASANWPYRHSDDPVTIQPDGAGPGFYNGSDTSHPLDKTNVPAGLNANTDSSVKENGTNSSSRDSGKGFP